MRLIAIAGFALSVAVSVTMVPPGAGGQLSREPRRLRALGPAAKRVQQRRAALATVAPRGPWWVPLAWGAAKLWRPPGDSVIGPQAAICSATPMR